MNRKTPSNGFPTRAAIDIAIGVGLLILALSSTPAFRELIGTIQAAQLDKKYTVIATLIVLVSGLGIVVDGGLQNMNRRPWKFLYGVARGSALVMFGLLLMGTPVAAMGGLRDHADVAIAVLVFLCALAGIDTAFVGVGRLARFYRMPVRLEALVSRSRVAHQNMSRRARNGEER